MVNKVELGTLTQVSNNEQNFLKALNQNFTALQKAINDTLSRSGVTPNEMNEVLDMNGKRVINIGRAIEATDAVTKQDIQDIIDRAEQAIAGVDQIIVAAKAAVEAYAQEYIYPVAQAALDGAVAAKNAAEAARDALLEDEGYQKLIQNLDELVELADHAEELQAIVDNIDELLAVAEDIEAIKSVAENLSGLKSIVDNMQEILQASTYASQAAASASTASTAASTATSAASTATTKASEASASATSAAGSASTATTKASEAAASATQADAAVTAAGTSAQQASTSATHALIWAEGDDEAVEALGGEHSAKGWAEEAAQTVEGKQDKLTSANAGDNVTITEVSGVVKINAEAGVEVITVTGESGTLTAEQIAKINEGCAIVCDGEVFRLSDESSTLSYKTFINSNAANTETMSFKAIYVQLSQGTVNYGRWTKEPVPVSSGPTYSAGANIQISSDNVISATDTTYTAGTGIEINNGVISATGGDIETYNSLSEAQRTTILSTGKYHNVDVVNGTIFETYQGKFEQFTKTATGTTINWSSATSPYTYAYAFVGDGTNVYASVSDSQMAKSTDRGSTWSLVDLPDSYAGSLRSLAYGNGTIVGCCNWHLQGNASSRLFYCTDGSTWNMVPSGTAQARWTSVVFGNGVFVAAAEGTGGGEDQPSVYTSTNGINWTANVGYGTLPGYAKRVFWCHDRFVVLNNNSATNKVYYSLDGTTWSTSTLDASMNTLLAGYVGGSYFVICGLSGTYKVYKSTDFSTWTSMTLTTFVPRDYNSIACSPEGYAIVASDNICYITSDASTWTAQSVVAYYAGIANGDVYANGTSALSRGTPTTSYTYSLTDLNADHLKNNSTASQALAIGTSATATATRSIAVGPTAAAEGTNSLALGYAAMAGRAASGTVTASTYDIAIGPMSTATAASYGTAIGYSSQSSGQYGTAIGASARATAARAVGIGYSARAQAENAVQIGQGNNSTAGTLQFRSYPLVDADGKIVADRIGSIPAYNSLSNLQRTTLLSSGTYGGADVVNGTIFTTEPGKFEQFSKTANPPSLAFSSMTTPNFAHHKIGGVGDDLVIVNNGQSTSCIYSTNGGSSWSTKTLTSKAWQTVAGPDKILLLPYDSGLCQYYNLTTDTFLESSIGSSGRYIGLYDGSKYIIYEITGWKYAFSSTDGVTWTSRGTPASGLWSSVATDKNGHYVSVQQSGYGSYVSTDGFTWSAGGNLPSNTNWKKVCYGNGVWFACAAGVSAKSTNNGTSWSSVTGPSGFAFSDMTFTGDTFVGVSNGIVYSSTDGSTWTSVYTTSGATDIEYVNTASKLFLYKSDSYARTSITVGTVTVTYDYALTALSYDKATTDTLLAAKQGTLTAGTNITIDENNVISATGGGSAPTYDPATQELTF